MIGSSFEHLLEEQVPNIRRTIVESIEEFDDALENSTKLPESDGTSEVTFLAFPKEPIGEQDKIQLENKISQALGPIRSTKADELEDNLSPSLSSNKPESNSSLLTSVCNSLSSNTTPLGSFILLDPAASISPSIQTHTSILLEWLTIEKHCNPRLVFINNCNIPYHAGGWIKERLLASSEWTELLGGTIRDDSFMSLESESESNNNDLLDDIFGIRSYSLMIKKIL